MSHQTNAERFESILRAMNAEFCEESALGSLGQENAPGSASRYSVPRTSSASEQRPGDAPLVRSQPEETS